MLSANDEFITHKFSSRFQSTGLNCTLMVAWLSLQEEQCNGSCSVETVLNPRELRMLGRKKGMK
jgi:hypothetical protein